MPLGNYSLNADFLSYEHQKFKLTTLECGARLKAHKIALILDKRSASNKLYITCPYCHKQRQSLYAIKYAYGCRQCIGLHCASQSERPDERLMRRIRKLRKELWGYDWPEVNNMFEQVIYWPKPKWMRWKTFEQKRAKITELENKYWPMVITQLDNLFGEEYNHLLIN